MRGSMAAGVLLCCLVLGGCANTAGGGGSAAAPGEPAQAAPAPPDAAPDAGGISAEEAQKLPPLAPARVQVADVNGKVTVLWQGTGSPVSHYAVYRRTGGNQAWELRGTVPANAADAGQYHWVDTSPVAGGLYGVAAVSNGGVKSAIASS